VRLAGGIAAPRRLLDAAMWDELLAAFGLMLVLEGILPFLSPGALRQTLLRMAKLEDRVLRFAGLASMGLGLLVLYLFR
jgi:uncharacterized protein YjeT (DUF2065 family)